MILKSKNPCPNCGNKKWRSIDVDLGGGAPPPLWVDLEFGEDDMFPPDWFLWIVDECINCGITIAR
jgi:hypothetical protein